MWEAGDLARDGRTLLQENQSRARPQGGPAGWRHPAPAASKPPPHGGPRRCLCSCKALDSITDPAGLGPSQASPLSVCLPSHLLHTPTPPGLRGQEKFQRKGSGWPRDKPVPIKLTAREAG